MLSPPLQELNAIKKISEIRAAPIYLSYPPIYQRHLIPDDAFKILNDRWSTERIATPNTDFFLLNNVYVVSEGLVFTENAVLITETKTAYTTQEIEAARQKLLAFIESKAELQTHPKAILCKKRGANNYGHWLAEMLPKAFWSRRVRGIQDWPIVVYKSYDDLNRIVVESLELINIQKDQVIFTEDQPVFFNELIIIQGLTSHAFFMSPLVFECMEFIAAKAPPGKSDSLYVSRKPSTTRDFEDEDFAKKIFSSYGYEECITAEMSFAAQVGTFKSARRMVGAMGAAFSNTLFCRPGTNVLLFSPASALELFFWHIASGKKLNYAEIRCREIGDQKGPLPWDRALHLTETEIRNVIHYNDNLNEVSALNLDDENTVTRSLNLSINDVLGTWTWIFNNDPTTQKNVVMLGDGQILNHDHPNQRSWRLTDGTLEILAADGRCSWRFDDIKSTVSPLKMRASYRLEQGVTALLVCEKLGS